MKSLLHLFLLPLLASSSVVAQKPKTKVFILAGQSNMEGQGVVHFDHPKSYNSGKGNLVWSLENSKSAPLMKHLRDKNGKWVQRNDVTISFQAGDPFNPKGKKFPVRKGPLTVGYTVYGSNTHIGPELQFGHIIGDHFQEPVLLIKTAWGGKSLYKDFRPPSSKGQTGTYYTRMMQEITTALKELNQPFEITAFVWQQGWNDMVSESARKEYADNLVNLAKDVRAQLNQPNLPFIVGELGNSGKIDNPNRSEAIFRKTQKEGTQKIPNAIFVETAHFSRPKNQSPNPSHGHHWFGNAESYFLIGDALGKATLKLLH